MAKKTPVQKAPAKTAAKPREKAPSKTKGLAVKPKPPAPKTPAKKPLTEAAPKLASKQSSKVPSKSEVPKKASKDVSAKAKAKPRSSEDRVLSQQFVRRPIGNKNQKLTPFLAKQHQRLLNLKDSLLDAMRGVARDNLHSGSETSAFGMHQADAGSDAYDRDFALGMLSKEQGSLYEIDEALKRIEDGSYGVCEICEKPIRHDRLEALPFTRYTVECQAELEKRQHHHSVRPHINSLFGLTEEETESEEEENTEVS